MKPPYYYTSDDRTKRVYEVWTCTDIEKGGAKRIAQFRYTQEKAHIVHQDMWNFIHKHMERTGGCKLFDAWIEKKGEIK